MSIVSKSRVQFEVLTPRLARIDELRNVLGLETRKDYFDHALTIFEWAIRQTEAGRVVGTLEPSTGIFHELVYPCITSLQDEVTAAARATAQASISKVADNSPAHV